jgi:hypothetical protein
MGHSNGPTVANISVPGTRASSMVAECMSMLREKRSMENGSMARGLDGSRTD